MRKFHTRRTGGVLAAGVVALVLVLAGLFFFGPFGGDGAVAVSKERAAPVQAPDGNLMHLTVPAMERVDNVPVYDAPANDNATLDKGALHVRGTGFPWQREANVYIAGHRLGYRGTGSYLLFYDLDKLRKGDEIILTDANGTRYTYEVFRKFTVNPDAVGVLQPVPGKNIVSLQTCTLPDYAQRLIVQGELKSVS